MPHRDGVHSPAPYHTFFARFSQAYRVEMERFVAGVTSGASEAPITGKMVLAVSKICNALHVSAREGRAVDIQWQPEEVPEQYTMKRLK